MVKIMVRSILPSLPVDWRKSLLRQKQQKIEDFPNRHLVLRFSLVCSQTHRVVGINQDIILALPEYAATDRFRD